MKWVLAAFFALVSKASAEDAIRLRLPQVTVIGEIDEAGFPRTTDITATCKKIKGGTSETLCAAAACLEDTAFCWPDQEYEPGCCVATAEPYLLFNESSSNLTQELPTPDEECTGASCGALCPALDEICVPRSPDCTNARCLDCDVDYELVDVSVDYDCFRTGLYRANGEPAKYGIGCGTDGSQRGCKAWRTGRGLNHSNSLITDFIGCEELADALCGDEPFCTFTCNENDSCFRVGIDFFEGKNRRGLSFFNSPSTGDISIVTPSFYFDGVAIRRWSRETTVPLCTLEGKLGKCASRASSHSDFMTCLTEETGELALTGVLSEEDRKNLLFLGAVSSIGKNIAPTAVPTSSPTITTVIETAPTPTDVVDGTWTKKKKKRAKMRKRMRRNRNMITRK